MRYDVAAEAGIARAHLEVLVPIGLRYALLAPDFCARFTFALTNYEIK